MESAFDVFSGEPVAVVVLSFDSGGWGNETCGPMK